MAPRTLARLLKELREKQGLTQRALAAKAKTTGAYIAMLETGVKKNPSSAVLRRLAKALEVPMDVLAFADQDIVLVTKVQCERCGREIVVHGFGDPGQKVSDERRADIERRALGWHQEDCSGPPTARKHPATRRPQ